MRLAVRSLLRSRGTSEAMVVVSVDFSHNAEYSMAAQDNAGEEILLYVAPSGQYSRYKACKARSASERFCGVSVRLSFSASS